MGGIGRVARSRWAILLAAGAGLAAGSVASRAAAGDPDRAAIEAIVHDYILAHPEIIPQAIEELRTRQTKAAIDADRSAIETPFAGAWAGNPKGDVTLVMFSDYACPYCKASGPEVDRLLAEDPKLKVVWREIPVLGPQSEAAARDALAAAKQGRYLPFHRALLAASGRPDEETVAAVGRGAGLDPAKLAVAGTAPDIAAEIAHNLALAGKLGIDGTPTFVVGDRMLSGAVGYEALKAAIAAVRRG